MPNGLVGPHTEKKPLAVALIPKPRWLMNSCFQATVCCFVRTDLVMWSKNSQSYLLYSTACTTVFSVIQHRNHSHGYMTVYYKTQIFNLNWPYRCFQGLCDQQSTLWWAYFCIFGQNYKCPTQYLYEWNRRSKLNNIFAP